jgi:hypothetical protein
VEAFALSCACGHQFTNTSSSPSIQDFTQKLRDIGQSGAGPIDQARQADFIRNWPIPVNAGDLQEFVTLAGSNALVGLGKSSVVSEAWRAKAIEAIQKGRIAFKSNDPGYKAMLDLEQRLGSDQRTRIAVGASRGAFKMIIIGVIIAVLVFGGLLVAISAM